MDPRYLKGKMQESPLTVKHDVEANGAIRNKISDITYALQFNLRNNLLSATDN